GATLLPVVPTGAHSGPPPLPDATAGAESGVPDAEPPVLSAQAAEPLDPNAAHREPGAGPTAARDPKAVASPAVLWVNSKLIRLNYEVRGAGPSGISAVEVWHTRDGRAWQKLLEETRPRVPLFVAVKEEGRHGFALVVRSGAGVGRRPPQAGDPPQVWV